MTEPVITFDGVFINRSIAGASKIPNTVIMMLPIMARAEAV